MWRREFKQMILINATLVIAFLLWNLSEYPSLERLGSPVYFGLSFPFLIQFETAGHAALIFDDYNFSLIIFLLAVAMNLYLTYRLQKKLSP